MTPNPLSPRAIVITCHRFRDTRPLLLLPVLHVQKLLETSVNLPAKITDLETLDLLSWGNE